MKKTMIGDVPVTYFLNEEIKAEKSAVEELESFLRIQNTISELSDEAKVEEVAITADFHKGRGIPVGTTIFTKGFVIPQAIGNDINCGMRLYTTGLKAEVLDGKLDGLERKLRYIFFEGGRNIPMNRIMREAVLKEGLIGLLDTHRHACSEGLWKYYDSFEQERDLNQVNKMGSFVTTNAYGFDDFLGNSEMSRDDQIGSVGGGNHFVEIQRIKRITNGSVANAWGLKEDQLVIMIHTGSVSIGHHSGNYIRDILKNVYPKTKKHPENGIYPLVLNDENQESFNLFLSLLHNAANYAFCNRLMLGLMTKASLMSEIGEFDYKLLYDAPHNYIWEEEIDGAKGFLHRKGSCTAKGLEQMQNSSFAYTGEPVFIPGSMGASSFILAGRGNRESLFSASHGAGRAMSRGKASKVSDEVLDTFMNKFRVVTPIDPNRADLKGREDILSKWREEIKKEAPFAYKDISPVIRSHTDFNMADIVAETEPILTIKG